MRNVLIIGGGTAGISAAATLAQFGVRSTIVEKASRIGGLANELACKGRVRCVRCDVCLAVDRISPIIQNDLVTIMTCAQLDMLERDITRYRATIESGPMHVEEEKCTSCGLCAEVCPSHSITRTVSRSGIIYKLDNEICRREDPGCHLCKDACPSNAIDLNADVSSIVIEADALIVASGFEPFDPAIDGRLGYGTVKGVVSSVEAEAEINRLGRLNAMVPGRKIGKVAFIQCVGSRDPHLGNQLCSKVCCKYAMKLAKQILTIDPEIKISIFFMDWRPTDRSDDLLIWASPYSNVRAVRSRPAEVFADGSGHPVVRYASLDEERVMEERFDLVILSVGIAPNKDNADLASLLGVNLNQHGFFFGQGKLVQTLERKGMFFAGTCSGPQDIEEAAMDGTVAASKAFRYLEGLK